MAYPSCSVIITTCDRPDELRRSIASVMGQTVRPQELIVVDDCSSHPDDSAVAEHRRSCLRFITTASRSAPEPQPPGMPVQASPAVKFSCSWMTTMSGRQAR